MAGHFGEVSQGYPVPVYTPRGRTAFQIDVIFSIPPEDVLASPTRRASPRGNRSSTPAPLPAGVNPAQGDSVTVRGVSYTVADVRPDGFGNIVLILSEAS